VIEWTVTRADNDVFCIHGPDGKHFANLRFVDDPDLAERQRRLALIGAAPELADAVAYLLPRAHVHLSDRAMLDAFRVILLALGRPAP
jgi:hypothetical protein